MLKVQLPFEGRHRAQELPRLLRGPSEFGGRHLPLGSYVKYLEYPSKRVHRHATNWGFFLHSSWVLLTSWEMMLRADLDASDPLHDDNLEKLVTLHQWSEADQYNRGLGWTDSSSDEDGEEDATGDTGEHDDNSENDDTDEDNGTEPGAFNLRGRS